MILHYTLINNSFCQQVSNTIFSPVSGCSLALVLFMTYFACENSLSAGTLVAGIDKYFLANNDNVGKRFSCCFQNFRGKVAYFFPSSMLVMATSSSSSVSSSSSSIVFYINVPLVNVIKIT